MADLLTKHTRMKVIQIEDNQKIEPNSVYLNPPDKNVVITDGMLHLTEPTQLHGVNLPIDCFFRSLSEDQGDLHYSVRYRHRRHPGFKSRKGRRRHGNGSGTGVGKVRRDAQQRHRHRAGGFYFAGGKDP